MTRIIRSGAVIAAVTLVVGFGLWSLWVPHYRPDLRTGETFGLDVSNHQGEVDWTAVAGDEISFAYVKATEGGDFVDAYFDRNWTEAKAAGLDVGAYHFFTLCTSGAEQATNALAVIPHNDMDLPLALDLEFAGNCSRRPSDEWIDNEVRAFIDIVEAATGEQIILYISTKFEAAYPLKGELGRDLWERRLWRRPPADTWVFWQWSDRAAVDGVDGGVDINIGRY